MKKYLIVLMALAIFSCNKIQQAKVVNYTDRACQQDIATSMSKAIQESFKVEYKVGTAGLSGVLRDIHNGKYSSLTYKLNKDGTKYFMDFVFATGDSGCSMVMIERKATKGSSNTSAKNNISGLSSYKVSCECKKVEKK